MSAQTPTRKRSIFRSRQADLSQQDPSSSRRGDYSASSATSVDMLREVPPVTPNGQSRSGNLFNRRSSLEITSTKHRKNRSFFQRRGSMGGDATGSTPSTIPETATPSNAADTSEHLDSSENFVSPPQRRRSFFRRNSIEAASSAPARQITETDVNTNGAPGTAPKKPFRRGSFGPSGDAQPPRPVRRRASIGEESPSSMATTVAHHGAISGERALLPDMHQDSMKRAGPRRVSRRSSLGPGISTADISKTPAKEQEMTPTSKKSLKDSFVNAFRRKDKKKKKKNKKEQQGQGASAVTGQSNSWSHQQGENGDDSERDIQQELNELQKQYQADFDRQIDYGYVEPEPLSPEGRGSQGWKPGADDMLEDEDFYTSSPLVSPGRTVRFDPQGPKIHTLNYKAKDSDEPFDVEELKPTLWWNSEEMAQIRQDCMDVVKDYLDDTEYMEAITKLFTAYKKSVTEEDVEAALEQVSHRKPLRGLEMHLVPRGGLLCEKHRRIVLTNVASATVDGLSNTGEGWLMIRKESMKASRPCRQYAQKIAEHDAMEAIEATISPWSLDDDDGAAAFHKRRILEEEDDMDDEEEEEYYFSGPKRSPFSPTIKDSAPTAPLKRFSEEEDINLEEEEEGSALQQAGEGSSQDSKA